MKQIYTSLRHENIERVVELLSSHGIETSVINKRSYNDSSWKRFSYSQKPAESEWPQVWLVNSDDQTQARELLRQIGIEPAIRYADELAVERRTTPPGPQRHRSVANKVRLAVLGLIGVAAVMLMLQGFGLFAKKPPPEKPQVIPVSTH